MSILALLSNYDRENCLIIIGTEGTLELPGVMCYGQSRDEAISNAERLAIEVIADRIAHGELPSSALAVSFSIPDEQLARQ